MLHRLIPRPVRRLWSEAALWRWCLILAVASSGMLWVAAPPSVPKLAVQQATSKTASAPPLAPQKATSR
jgi:hypothetical protein